MGWDRGGSATHPFFTTPAFDGVIPHPALPAIAPNNPETCFPRILLGIAAMCLIVGGNDAPVPAAPLHPTPTGRGPLYSLHLTRVGDTKCIENRYMARGNIVNRYGNPDRKCCIFGAVSLSAAGGRSVTV